MPVIVSKDEIKQIKEVVKTISKWDGVNYGGRQSIPAGDAMAAFERMDRVLSNNCIYIVPVGELEGFVKEIGGHGPEWVNEVFEKYSDLDNPVYEQAKNFIQSIEL